MKQIIPFVKDIDLNSKIAFITSISLEHNLKMENNDSIVGVFTVSGKYKINEISINEEVFENNINFDITLDDKYDSKNVTIDIDDFYYEIINNEFLRVHIDVLIDNLVYVKEISPKLEEKDKEVTSIDKEFSALYREEKMPKVEIEEEILDISNDEEKTAITNDVDIDIMKQDKDTKKEEITMEKEEITSGISSNLLAAENCYTTYKVHIVRENDTIDTIIDKYKIDKEEIEKYNNIDNIILGSKLIIPIADE